ncbi:hypothetical protein HanRHA438_Chr07g0289241 [Helianthus annuus]|nr:hypothetical protein HanRHA438_Chr07g0289241 [Helianthus annuus]
MPQRGRAFLISYALLISLQLLNIDDVIKHKSGVRITFQFLFDRIMLALGNGKLLLGFLNKIYVLIYTYLFMVNHFVNFGHAFL